MDNFPRKYPKGWPSTDNFQRLFWLAQRIHLLNTKWLNAEWLKLRWCSTSNNWTCTTEPRMTECRLNQRQKPNVEKYPTLETEWNMKLKVKKNICGHLPTLVGGQTSGCIPTPWTVHVQWLCISCYVTVNKPVLSYLSLCLLPHISIFSYTLQI